MDFIWHVYNANNYEKTWSYFKINGRHAFVCGRCWIYTFTG